MVDPVSNERPQATTDWASLWKIRSDTTYLNHGSFSPALHAVRAERKAWIDRLDEQPMDFYLRQLEPAVDAARRELARFLGTEPERLVWVDNATYAMNVVAHSFCLAKGDEVLINDHEYGAVRQIWERKCQQAQAKLVIAKLPQPLGAVAEVLDSLQACVTTRTKLIVFSHVTSATALVMPAAEICHAFQAAGIAVCIDGPHAPAQIDLSLDTLGCDFYTASCHKWLCGSLGTGFLYVNPGYHLQIKPPVKGWGRLKPAVPTRWDEEFYWLGTRDPSGLLSVPKAIEVMEKTVGITTFRQYSQSLAEYAEKQLTAAFATQTLAERASGWYASMAHVPLPAGDWSQMQQQLWDDEQIEVMIVEFQSQWYVRVSCHMYNSPAQIDWLVAAISRIMQKSKD